jgi:hypothetical protein
MKCHKISIRFNAGEYGGKYLLLKSFLTYFGICSINSCDL